MTCIVWDGKTLAGDKMALTRGRAYAGTKVRKIRGNLVGIAGDMALAEALFAWFADGCKPEAFPKQQQDPEKFNSVVVITPNREIMLYETSPIPWKNEKPFYSAGTGGDYAIGAVMSGADAKTAVEIASKICPWTGNGVDTVSFDEE